MVHILFHFTMKGFLQLHVISSVTKFEIMLSLFNSCQLANNVIILYNSFVGGTFSNVLDLRYPALASFDPIHIRNMDNSDRFKGHQRHHTRHHFKAHVLFSNSVGVYNKVNM